MRHKRSTVTPVNTRSHIRLRMIVHMAIENLKFKRFRTFLTILGVAIGSGSVFLLLSLGLGMQDLVQKQITDGQSINTIDITTSGSKAVTLTNDNIQRIASIAHVTEVSGVYTSASKVTIEGATANIVVYGVDKRYLEGANLVTQAGRLIDPAKLNEAMMSSSLLQAIGINDFKKALGKELTLNLALADNNKVIPHKLRLVGVIDSGSGSELFVSSDVYKNAGSSKFATAKAYVDDRASISDVRRSIESLGYNTASPVDTLEQVDQVFRVFRLVLAGFGSIGMIIAILGMLNMLTVSLLERTREIALMIIIGGRMKDMRLLFIVEAVLLSIVGGIVGMIAAGALGKIVDMVLNQLARSRGVADGFSIFAMPLWLVVLTLGAMALVGFLVAFIPATRASRINPVEALRRE